VTVVTPPPGGGTSNVAFFTVTTPTSSVAFGYASSVPTGSDSPASVAAGDFNGDGKLDLAVAMTGDMVFILLGDGTGKFTLASSPACGGSAGTSGPPPLTGTPAGTYTLSVAASGSGLTNNTSLTLVVN
jgi:hypothetical protein